MSALGKDYLCVVCLNGVGYNRALIPDVTAIEIINKTIVLNTAKCYLCLSEMQQ